MLQRPLALPLRHAAALGSLGLLVASGVGTAAWADTARRFVHTTEADFSPGEADGFSVSPFGELVPAPAYEEGGKLPEGVDTLLALASVGERTYAAASTETGEARVLVQEPGSKNWTVVASFPEAQVFSLHGVGDLLLVGISSGEGESCVSALVDGEPRPVLALPDDRYIWSIVGGTHSVPLLVATGIEGRVLSANVDDIRRAAEGKADAAAPTVVLDTAQSNVLTLAASPEGFPVYAGTDTDGVVYRIHAAEDGGPLQASAVFDASEPEVAAVVVASDGRVYVGTADAQQARPGRLNNESSESTGRPTPADAPDDSAAAEAPPTEPEPAGLDADAAATDSAAVSQETQAEAQGNEAGETGEGASDEDASSPEPAADGPRQEDYDALRETLRERLAEAEDSGELEVEGVAAAPKASRPRTRDQPAADNKEGNAVYEVLPDGSFREVFRESSMMLSLALTPNEHQLLVGTGSEGELHAVDLSGGGTTRVRDLKSQQITALLSGPDGTLLAAANPAATGVVPVGGATARAVYTSVSLDAGRRALFGRIAVTTSPASTGRLQVETRSGATADPEAAPWNPWREAGFVELGDPTSTLAIPSTPARFLQYRLTLESSPPKAPENPAGSDARADGSKTRKTPIALEAISLSYAVPNLAPQVQRLTLEASAADEPGKPRDSVVKVKWKASDPDEDELLYELSWRAMNSDRWLTLAKELGEDSHDWDTLGLADGLYHVRVTASDRLDNPPGSQRSARRRSDAFLVDNTGPVLEADVEHPDGQRRLTGSVRDAAGTVASVAFRVNDQDTFRPLAADDLLFDSAEEAFSLPLGFLGPDQGHVLTLRAMDRRGNASFKTIVIPAR